MSKCRARFHRTPADTLTNRVTPLLSDTIDPRMLRTRMARTANHSTAIMGALDQTMVRNSAQSRMIILSGLDPMAMWRHLTKPSCEPRTFPERENITCTKEGIASLRKWTARLSIPTGD
jgi:hypothetical protein